MQWPDCHDFDGWQDPEGWKKVNPPQENDEGQPGHIECIGQSSTGEKCEDNPQSNEEPENIELRQLLYKPLLSIPGQADAEQYNGNDMPGSSHPAAFQFEPPQQQLVCGYAHTQPSYNQPSLIQIPQPTDVQSSLPQWQFEHGYPPNPPLFGPQDTQQQQYTDEGTHILTQPQYNGMAVAPLPANIHFPMPQPQFPQGQFPKGWFSQGRPELVHPAVLPVHAFPNDCKIFYDHRKESVLKNIVWNELKKREPKLQSGFLMSQFNQVIGHSLARYAQDLGCCTIPDGPFNHPGGYTPRNEFGTYLRPHHRPAGYEPRFEKTNHPEPQDQPPPPCAEVYLLKMPNAPLYLPILSTEIRRVYPDWQEPVVITPVQWFPATLFTGHVQYFRAEQFLHEGLTATSFLVNHQLCRLLAMDGHQSLHTAAAAPIPPPLMVGPIRRNTRKTERGRGRSKGVRGRGDHGTNGAGTPVTSASGPAGAQDSSDTVMGTVMDTNDPPLQP
ncbi:hypothetical protein AA313_de0210026 [Arthrobotrys entomopaga]|nr:hypothetical protein AA313_de0210026 [Arthrobotrys entomopaga]